MDEKQKLQNVILIIAREIDRICRDNNIKYFMDGGTQLGAVRHGGFIPWDDDFDIGMRRSEFKRFLTACRKYLDSEKFYLETVEDAGYGFSFAKIHLNNTEIIENFSKNAKVHRGIFVDIFPYDNIPDSFVKRKFFLLENHVLKNMIWIKENYGDETHRKQFRYKLLKLLGKAVPLPILKQGREHLIQKYNKIETKYCFTSDYPQNVFQSIWLDDVVRYPFEDASFLGVRQYDDFLTTLYGNYMELPPIEKRIVHSNHKVDYGSYEL